MDQSPLHVERHESLSETRDSARARRAELSLVAWVPVTQLDFRAWVLEGRRIGAVSRGSAWWVGDWLDYGAAKWGERYAKAAKVTGYDPKTLRNLRYVAARVPQSLRRDELTWSHHALVAALPLEAQRHWLERAASDRFTVEDLRAELRRARSGLKVEELPDGRAHDAALSRRRDAQVRSEHELFCPQCGYQLSRQQSADGQPTITGVDAR
jgi:hypothetical protein